MFHQLWNFAIPINFLSDIFSTYQELEKAVCSNITPSLRTGSHFLTKSGFGGFGGGLVGVWGGLGEGGWVMGSWGCVGGGGGGGGLGGWAKG